MKDFQKRIRVVFVGLLVFCGWMSLELTQANARLSATEMESVVGGLGGCDMFTTDYEGYRCSQFASMSCTLICSKCSNYSSNEGLCVNYQCWNCENGVGSQVKECAVGTEAQTCRNFGGGPQYGVCGFEYDRYCKYDAAEQRCYCETPLQQTDLACARKDCQDL